MSIRSDSAAEWKNGAEVESTDGEVRRAKIQPKTLANMSLSVSLAEVNFITCNNGSPLLHFFSFYACVLYELRPTTSK